MKMTTYKIKRFYADKTKEAVVIKRGLTLEEAQKHCKDPETSSSTATSAKARNLTEMFGPWFDGYEAE